MSHHFLKTYGNYRLAYHLMPPSGWINDPNGLCQIDDQYHIYYQYAPDYPESTLKCWGHDTTRDFVHYEVHPPVLFPDTPDDCGGVYSGSAFQANGRNYFFYTGNVKLTDRTDYDYINSGRLSNVIRTLSDDGFHFSEKEVLLKNEDYPADMTAHVRDPKIIRHKEGYDMILGGRTRSGKGCVLFYRSTDLKTWVYHHSFGRELELGYMWECPDLIELDGRYFLICCPQGVEERRFGLKHRDLTVCMELACPFDAEGIRCLSVHPLDSGRDFYAPQSFVDKTGRRILLAWMGSPVSDVLQPTAADGWMHALTLPRLLCLQDGKLCQKPLPELEALRGESFCGGKEDLNRMCWEQPAYELLVRILDAGCFCLSLSEEYSLQYDGSTLLFSAAGEDGAQLVYSGQLDDLRLFSDVSSLEIFVNGGERSFAARIFPQKRRLLRLTCADEAVWFQMYRLKPINVRYAE